VTSLTESTSVSSPAAVVERVLIVEDELAARSGLEQLVRSWGFVAESASDGREALEKVTTFRPAIVITDLVMPGMDGLELLRALNQQGADVTTLLRARHAGHINAAMEKLRQGGVAGNQMPASGLGGVPDDFTVKTQSSEALTKGLYTSVAAFILANMPKLDEANMAEMKVLSHEADSLGGELHLRVSGKKEKYTKLARQILIEVQQQKPKADVRIDLTVATYALFGMMNWIYNWYNPRGKLSVAELVDNVTRLYLGGFLNESPESPETRDVRAPAALERLSVWREPNKKTA